MGTRGKGGFTEQMIGKESKGRKRRSVAGWVRVIGERVPSQRNTLERGFVGDSSLWEKGKGGTDGQKARRFHVQRGGET